MDDSPVFVAGLPRTGKTPLRIALGAHPDLSITRKTRMWTTHFGRYGDLSSPQALDACLSALLDDPLVARLLPDERAIRAEFSRRRPTYANLLGVVHALYAHSIGRTRWGEQMAGLESFADDIFDSWPNARFIHMVRHPASWIGRGAVRRPGRLGSEVTTWTESARRAIDNRDHHGPRYMIVHYEDLLAEPVAVLRTVGELIEEEFNFGVGDLMVKALPSSASPPLRGPARRYVEARTRPLLSALGYAQTETEYRLDGVTDTAAAAWYEMGHNLAAAKDAS